jgi:hypothetical protein
MRTLVLALALTAAAHADPIKAPPAPPVVPKEATIQKADADKNTLHLTVTQMVTKEVAVTETVIQCGVAVTRVKNVPTQVTEIVTLQLDLSKYQAATVAGKKLTAADLAGMKNKKVFYSADPKGVNLATLKGAARDQVVIAPTIYSQQPKDPTKP